MSAFDYCEARFISAQGPDATRFLSGQLTQNIEDLLEGNWAYSFVCDAKGRIQFHLEITKTQTGYLLKSESTAIEALLARLDRFLIADDCELVLEEKVVSSEKSEAERILAGIPLLQDLEDNFPAETSLLDSAVSFAKGCYQGQEVISRMKRAGKTNQKLIKGTISEKPNSLPFELLDAETQKGLFKVTSVTHEAHGEGFPCLGYVKRSSQDAASLTGSEGHLLQLT